MTAPIPPAARHALDEVRRRRLALVAAQDALAAELDGERAAIEAAAERLRESRLRLAVVAQNAEASALKHLRGAGLAVAEATPALSLDAPAASEPYSPALAPAVGLPKPDRVPPIGAVPLAFDPAPPDEDEPDEDDGTDLGGEGAAKEWPEVPLPHPADPVPVESVSQEDDDLAHGDAPQRPSLAASSERIATNGTAQAQEVTAAANAPSSADIARRMLEEDGIEIGKVLADMEARERPAAPQTKTPRKRGNGKPR